MVPIYLVPTEKRSRNPEDDEMKRILKYAILIILLSAINCFATDTSVKDMTATTTPVGTDIIYIIVDPGTTPLDRKVALSNLWKGILPDVTGKSTYLLRVDATATGYELLDPSTFVITETDPLSIPLATIAAAGDVLVGASPGTPTIIAKGANNTIFGVDNAGTLGFNTKIAQAGTSGTDFNFYDPTVTTKKAQFDFSAITAATIRAYAWPDVAGTVALTSNITSAISNTAYDEGTWNGVSTIAPSKDAVRDQVESMLTTIGLKVAKTDVIKLASFFWDGGGSAVTTGATTKRCTQVPHAATITGCFIKASPSSTLTLTPYKDAFATGALATTALISGAGTTGVTGTLGLNDETLTNWTTSITAKDEICAQVTTNNNALWIEFQIYGHR